MSNLLRTMNYRFWSNDEIRKICGQLSNYHSVINVSGWADRDKEGGAYKDYFRKAVSYHVSNHPGDLVKGSADGDDIEIDLQKPLRADLVQQYDLVFNHTVLEHVPDPVFAFDQLASLSKDLLLLIVPWKQQFHFIPGAFGDYYRFSPMLIRQLYEKNGFTLLYENFTPEPSVDTYLIHLGSKKPELHSDFVRQVQAIESLNGIVGHAGYSSIIMNVFLRVAYRGYLLLKQS